jgi:hypothetical protein
MSTSASEKLVDILQEAEVKYDIPRGLLIELIKEERLRLYQIKKKPLREEVKAIFERFEGRR